MFLGSFCYMVCSESTAPLSVCCFVNVCIFPVIFFFFFLHATYLFSKFIFSSPVYNTKLRACSKIFTQITVKYEDVTKKKS